MDHKILQLPVYNSTRNNILIYLDILVDSEIFNEIKDLCWRLRYDCGSWRVYRIHKHKTEFLHNFIWKHYKMPVLLKGYTLDHLNHNPLDNRLENLKAKSQQDQTRNTRPRLNCTSKFKGVHWKKDKNKWASKIYDKNLGNIFLGYYSDEIEAAKAYDKKAKEIWLDKAYLNFQDNYNA